MQVQFTIPDLGEVSTRSWLIIALLLGAAVASSIVVELYKRHYFKKKDVKLAKSWVAVWLTGSSVFFTYLGYVLVLATANMSLLSGLPYVGKHFAAVLGIAYTIYNLRLNKWYQGISNWLAKWSKSNDETITPLAAGATATVVAPNSDEREFTLPE